MALEIGHGDEVICPSFTFPSTANAIVRQGGVPVFADVREDSLNIDPNDVARKITRKTKAIMPVHYAGVACEMDEIAELASQQDIFVVEDAAQGVNAKYKERFLGTIGDVGCYSFHATKNLTCGEGGAFLTNNHDLAARAEIIREKGTNRSAFLRGEVDKYSWVTPGSSYVLSDILAAVLSAQLDKLNDVQRKREAIYRYYLEALRDLDQQGKLKLPAIPKCCDSNYHIFYVLLPDELQRNHCLERLRRMGVAATFHYVPLHSSPYGRSLAGCRRLHLPITESVSIRILRLPIYPGLKRGEMEYVVESFRRILQ